MTLLSVGIAFVIGALVLLCLVAFFGVRIPWLNPAKATATQKKQTSNSELTLGELEVLIQNALLKKRNAGLSEPNSSNYLV